MITRHLFVIALLLLAITGISSGAQLTGDTFSTAWSMNPYVWANHPLPSLGLERATHPLSLSYNFHETGQPASIDWRSTKYGTRVTPVQDQDGCGACVAYAVIGQIESLMEIAQNSTRPLPNLAEMEFFSHGGSCGSGWNFEGIGNKGAYAVAKNTGIMTQNCYDSGTCKDRVYITSWSTTKSPKEALQNGPIVTGVDWDQNWFYYDGGIINSYTGDVAGGHALCIVGYSDIGGYWIVKNSWGTAWGESGYFRIDYTTAAEAGMGTSYPWYTALVNASPVPPGPPVSDNKTFSARTLSRPTGDYLFDEVSPDAKPILTTKAYQMPMPFGVYPSAQAFIFSIKTPSGTFLSTDTKHASVLKTSAGYWIVWRGINKIPYRSDAYVEIARA